MKLLGQYDGAYFFCPRKNEDTDTAIDRISEIMDSDYHYTGLTSENDVRANGYQDIVERLSEKIDFTKYSLIIAKKKNDAHN